MSRLREAASGFVRFWWRFVIGDDWTVAAGVLLGLGVTYGLLRSAAPAWWVLPLVAVALVATSVRRANRREAERD